MKPLGKLTRVGLREIWPHEALDFTNWLAEDKNLEILSNALGLEISLIKKESEVGKFSSDILAEDPASGRKIIIENQLEATDHDHLGKIITYASGVDAEFVIWLVAKAREEHEQAIDWLNEHTDEDINFLLVRIEALKIDDSDPAPNFHIISQPNDWAKAVKRSANSMTELSETKVKQLEFWEQFKEFAEGQKTSLRFRKTKPQHWYDISSGSSNWNMRLTLNTTTNTMACAVYIPDGKTLFKEFETHKPAIEEHLGSDIEWMELPEKKASRIKQSWPCNLDNEAEWPEYFKWLLYRAESFRETFSSIA